MSKQKSPIKKAALPEDEKFSIAKAKLYLEYLRETQNQAYQKHRYNSLPWRLGYELYLEMDFIIECLINDYENGVDVSSYSQLCDQQAETIASLKRKVARLTKNTTGLKRLNSKKLAAAN